VLVTVFDEEHMLASFEVAAELRQAGLKVACYPTAAKLPKQFKYADRMGMQAVVVIGPEEAASGEVTLKDLRAGTQRRVKRAEAAAAQCGKCLNLAWEHDRISGTWWL
jgi:histidyl-tRNA synthetase